MICDCKFDTNTAILKKIKTQKHKKNINIDDYNSNDKIKKKVNNGKYELVCEKGHKLIAHNCKKIKSFFTHYNSNFSTMTEWHKKWQSMFEDENCEFSVGECRADVMINDYVLEFQHSKIIKEEINKRNDNYKLNNKKLIWIIECNNVITHDTDDKKIQIEFKNECWKYENFIDCNYILLNKNNKLYKISPKDVKYNFITICDNCILENNEFVEQIKSNEYDNDYETSKQCILYYNQRGAGCGKTYESIQLLQSEKFKNKKTFIYLTKMHSAKEVIINEIKEQYKDNKLEKLNIDFMDKENINKKQFKLTFYDKEFPLDIKEIIIGTIDSFAFALGDKNTQEKDYFNGIVKSLKNGYLNIEKNGDVKYGGKKFKINKQCMLIIDEAQDLDNIYMEAFKTVMSKTYFDVYVIGDKLQSISNEINVFTLLENNELEECKYVKIEKNIGINQVKRFHNNKFINFVNNLVDFKKYNLYEITKICENPNCKYKHEDEKIPYEIFYIPKCNYEDDKMNKTIDELINKFTMIIDKEIDEYNYLPNNFMFISPIIKQNFLLYKLETNLQNYWINKFKDKKYIENVLSKNNYWKNKIDDGKYYNYVVLHKSEENEPINLKESEYATRLLSIHASKGNGCEVVFVLGLSQDSLQKHSKEKCNLVYESLLHVALTRHKKSLYVGVENNNDDINERIMKLHLNENINLDDNLIDYKKCIKHKYDKIERVSNYVFNNKYEQINNIYKINDYNKQFDNEQLNDAIIDIGHHIIRKYVMHYYFMKSVINYEILERNFYETQFVAILKEVYECKVKIFDYKSYYNEICKKKRNDIIPILEYDDCDKSIYKTYSKRVEKIIKHVQNKLRQSLKNIKIPFLCPLETCILYYCIKILKEGKYSDFTINEVYKILYSYNECSDEINDEHQKFDCLCSKIFCNNRNSNNKYENLRNDIKNHYEKTQKIECIYNKYKTFIENKYKDNNYVYNVNHYIEYNGNFNNYLENFIFRKDFDIIANSDNYTILIKIDQLCNKLNYQEMFFKLLFDNFLILNSNPKHLNNIKRFSGKKIVSCIMSLDMTEPKFYEFDVLTNINIFNNCFYEYLYNRHIQSKYYVYKLYNNCLSKADEKKNSLNIMIDELATETSLPDFIIDIYRKILFEIENKNSLERNVILEKIKNEELFYKLFDEKLIYSIKNYIEGKTENDVF